jgi:hypothetical protein
MGDKCYWHILLQQLFGINFGAVLYTAPKLYYTMNFSVQ